MVIIFVISVVFYFIWLNSFGIDYMYIIVNRVILFFIKRNLNSKRGKIRINDYECMYF